MTDWRDIEKDPPPKECDWCFGFETIVINEDGDVVDCPACVPAPPADTGERR